MPDAYDASVKPWMTFRRIDDFCGLPGGDIAARNDGTYHVRSASPEMQS